MSFSILKTNVGLTTNTKILIDSKYKLYLESIDSNVELSSQEYKKFEFNKDSLYDEILPFFINKLPSDIVYDIKYDDDCDNMYSSFHSQDDHLYQCGARNIYNNKGYKEEYEHFSPLYIDGKLPSDFIIFRVDGSGNINLNNLNFIKEIVNNLKVVKSYNLGRDTPVGEWLYKNYIDNEYYISDSLNVDFRDGYFSSLSGIDVSRGGYVTKSFVTSDLFAYESTFHDMNTYFFDLYSNNGIVFPNILNLSFLYDDEVSDWSINRYYGFYFDKLDKFLDVSFYHPIKLVSSVLVEPGNILSHVGYDSPFVDINSVNRYYVEIGGIFSEIVPFEEVIGYGLVNIPNDVITQEKGVKTLTKWRIVSKLDYSNLTYSDLNQNTINVAIDGILNKSNGGSLITINEFETGDLWLIKIGEEYMSLVHDGTNLQINSDYNFDLIGNKLYIKKELNIKEVVKSLDDNGVPVSVGIYRCDFTEIKDFDTNIINSGFGNFEYDIDDSIIKSDESKLYYKDYSSMASPVELDEFFVNGIVENVPVSSEFIANGEVFQITNGTLSNIWHKNAKWCKWGFTKSLHTYDYPYILNNSAVAEEFNRGVNVYSTHPDRSERNLDYFYTVMSNSVSKKYDFHSLHVSNNFDLKKYMNVDLSDYFTYYFGSPIKFKTSSVSTDKWSNFNNGDNITPNTTVFRGLKVSLYDVKSIIINSGDITEMNIVSSAQYDDYKFSILFNNPIDEIISVNDGIPNYVNSQTETHWAKISNYEFGVSYEVGMHVMYYGIVWNCIRPNINFNPNFNPVNFKNNVGEFNWQIGSSILFTPNSIFKGMWLPFATYSLNDVVYYNGEYLKVKNTNLGVVDIWNPRKDYTIGEVIYYIGKYYIAKANINALNQVNGVEEPNISSLKWELVNNVGAFINKWGIVDVWSPNSDNYLLGTTTYWNGVLYLAIGATLSEPGTDDSIWSPLHTLNVVNDKIYPMGNLSLMGNSYYISTNNNAIIKSGIVIYVNKKWKNILININSFDGLVNGLTDTIRDAMYSFENTKMTAYNFIEYINGLIGNNGFSESIKYVIINQNGLVDYYTKSNIVNLPLYLSITKPDELFTLIDSLTYTNIPLNMNKFSINFRLDKSDIASLSMRNWYNSGIGLATAIKRNVSNISLISGYHGLTNVIYNRLFRHSGPYSPIFTKIDIFRKDMLLTGNYKFNVGSSNFGMIRDSIVSKVNRNRNILKLRNVVDTKSIYPMIDEFGYTTMDRFIFKSNWDMEYYMEVSTNDLSSITQVKNIKLKN